MTLTGKNLPPGPPVVYKPGLPDCLDDHLGPADLGSAVLPNSGPLAGGNTVTVLGTFLTGAATVAFGGTQGTSISVKTANALTVVAPPGAGSSQCDVQVTTPFGTSKLGPTDHYTYTNAPIVTGVNPSQGAPAGGTSVTITGLQMTNITGVAFGPNQGASFTQNRSTITITAVSPGGHRHGRHP